MTSTVDQCFQSLSRPTKSIRIQFEEPKPIVLRLSKELHNRLELERRYQGMEYGGIEISREEMVEIAVGTYLVQRTAVTTTLGSDISNIVPL